MNAFLSDAFFHMVGRASPLDHDANFGTLQAIIESEAIKCRGAVLGQSPTSLTVDLTKSLASGELVVPSMTCYCDIPLKSIAFHAKKYGHFGLAFHRDFLIRRGARPVMYVPMRIDDHSSVHGASLLRDIDATYRAFHKYLVIPSRAKEQSSQRSRRVGVMPDKVDTTIDVVNTALTLYFMAYLKAYDSELPESHPEYYYSEREWRITNYLRFVPQDVAMVVVAEGYQGIAARAMPKYAEKIVSI